MESQTEEVSEEEDYYSFFNISKDASSEEITKAYRRVSLMYHPDRHQDPELKDQAEVMFAKTRKAYEVLSDPHKRAIYDTVGSRGLDVQGWELAERRFSPQEVREEYDRLIRQREDLTLREQANPTGGITMTLNATDLFRVIPPEDLDVLEYDPREFPYVEMSGLSMQQSVEAPLSLKDRVILGGSLQTTNGRGGGGLSGTWRRLISQYMWAETSVSVGDDVSGAVKVVRTFSKRMFGSAQLGFHLEDGEFSPGVQFNVTRQLARKYTGSIVFKLGFHNSVTTSLIFDDSKSRHIVAALVVGDRTSFVMMSYTYRFLKSESHVKASARIGTFGVVAECGGEVKISEYSSMGCSFRLAMPRGALLAKLKLVRASQNYQVDVVLCDSQDYLPQSVVWGVVVPVLTAQTLKVMLKPVLRKWLNSEETESAKRRRQQEVLEQKRDEARRTIELMRETALKIRDEETRKKGLVILEAWYGKIVVSDLGSGDYEAPVGPYGKVVDVTTPLQTLVKDSKLLLYETAKWQLPGFFDPCPGEEKILRVLYQFREEDHKVIVRDDQPLFLPKKCTDEHNESAHKQRDR